MWNMHKIRKKTESAWFNNMDFDNNYNQPMFNRSFPFYVSYPQYHDWNQINEDRVLEDLEYLQQMYPTYSKKYQVRINNILDRMDYDGSMIYDQYPDRWQLERLIKNIMKTIRAEEEECDNTADTISDTDKENKWAWIQELVTIMLYYEILKRKKKKKNYYYF